MIVQEITAILLYSQSFTAATTATRIVQKKLLHTSTIKGVHCQSCNSIFALVCLEITQEIVVIVEFCVLGWIHVICILVDTTPFLWFQKSLGEIKLQVLLMLLFIWKCATATFTSDDIVFATAVNSIILRFI